MSYENTLEKVIIRLDVEEKEKDKYIAALKQERDLAIQYRADKIAELEKGKLARCAEESEKQSEYEGGLLDRIAELEKFKDYYQELVEARGYYGITDLLVADTKHKERIAELEEVVKAVAYIGVDFGYGKYELEAGKIDDARTLMEQVK